MWIIKTLGITWAFKSLFKQSKLDGLNYYAIISTNIIYTRTVRKSNLMQGEAVKRHNFVKLPKIYLQKKGKLLNMNVEYMSGN